MLSGVLEMVSGSEDSDYVQLIVSSLSNIEAFLFLIFLSFKTSNK